MRKEVTKDELIEAIQLTGSVYGAAKSLGKGYTATLKLLQRYDLTGLLPKGKVMNRPAKKEFMKVFKKLKGSRKLLESHYNIGATVLTRWLMEYGLSVDARPYVPVPPTETLISLMTQHKTFTGVGKSLGVDSDLVSDWCDKVNKIPDNCVSLAQAARNIGVTRMCVTVWVKNNTIAHKTDLFGKKYIPIDAVETMKEKRKK